MHNGKLRPTVIRPVCLCVNPHLGSKTRLLLLSDGCGFVDVGRPLWWKIGSIVYNYCRTSPAQSFTSPAGLVIIFFCIRFETLQPGGPSPRICIPQEQGGPIIPPGKVPSSAPSTRRATVELFYSLCNEDLLVLWRRNLFTLPLPTNGWCLFLKYPFMAQNKTQTWTKLSQSQQMWSQSVDLHETVEGWVRELESRLKYWSILSFVSRSITMDRSSIWQVLPNIKGIYILELILNLNSPEGLIRDFFTDVRRLKKLRGVSRIRTNIV
jgi:hypothetical protein